MTLEILTSDLLAGTRHGFFTRRGGASSGIYAGLNCGPGSRDQREAVALNRGAGRRGARGRARPAAVAAPGPLRPRWSSPAPRAGPSGPRADAAVTGGPGVALGVLTADCAPVLFADPEARVIGAAHAGWRGALDGVLEATVAAMERLGARAGRDPRGDRPDDQPARLRGRARSSSSASSTRRRATSASSSPARATGCASTCRASCWRGCARPGSARRPGSAPAPTPTPSASSPTAAPPTPASPTTAG